jgi:hypothetical protein
MTVPAEMTPEQIAAMWSGEWHKLPENCPARDAWYKLQAERDCLAAAGRKMRQTQAAYFADRSKERLIAAKSAEREFDGFLRAALGGTR